MVTLGYLKRLGNSYSGFALRKQSCKQPGGLGHYTQLQRLHNKKSNAKLQSDALVVRNVVEMESDRGAR